MTGIPTDKLPGTRLAESLIANYQGNTTQISVVDLAGLLGNGGSGPNSLLAVEVADRQAAIAELRDELEQHAAAGNARRVSFAYGIDMSGKTAVAEVDLIITAAGNSSSLWMRTTAPADGLETDTFKMAADGSWWEVWVDGRETDQRIDTLESGYLHFETGAVDPSGRGIPLAARAVYVNRNADNTSSLWRIIGAPDDGLETDALKMDAKGRWWRKTTSTDLLDEIAMREALDQDVAGLSADLDGLSDTVSTLHGAQLPGDDVVFAEAINGPVLAVRPDGVTRGNFLAEDVKGSLTAHEKDFLGSFVPTGLPGDGWMPIAVADNGVAAALDEQGRWRGTHVCEMPTLPGDWIIPTLIDARGLALEGYDIRDGSAYGASLGGDGASVEFVDPGIAGDAWGAVADANGVVKFMSPMWQGEVIGYETRNGSVLADTGATATGIVALGGGDIGLARAEREYPWHIVDEGLEYQGARNGADALAAAYLGVEGRDYRARPTVVALAEVIGSTVAADVLPGSPRRDQLLARIGTASEALAAWDKTLVVDRIKLALLSGAPSTGEATADAHYAAMGNGLRLDVATATGQQLLPRLIVNQSAGTRTDGTSEVILGEGRLDWEHFALGFVVPTPLYPFALAPGTPATLTQDAALMVSELEALAMEAVTAGGEWFCPSLEEASLSGNTITARFAALGGLQILDPDNHGFTIGGQSSTAVAITSVSASGSFVSITLDGTPDGSPVLNYAFGQSGDRGDGGAANRGSLTDSWSQQSAAVPSKTLHRFARSGRVSIQ